MTRSPQKKCVNTNLGSMYMWHKASNRNKKLWHLWYLYSDIYSLIVRLFRKQYRTQQSSHVSQHDSDKLHWPGRWLEQCPNLTGPQVQAAPAGWRTATCCRPALWGQGSPRRSPAVGAAAGSCRSQSRAVCKRRWAPHMFRPCCHWSWHVCNYNEMSGWLQSNSDWHLAK